MASLVAYGDSSEEEVEDVAPLPKNKSEIHLSVTGSQTDSHTVSGVSHLGTTSGVEYTVVKEEQELPRSNEPAQPPTSTGSDGERWGAQIRQRESDDYPPVNTRVRLDQIAQGRDTHEQVSALHGVKLQSSTHETLALPIPNFERRKADHPPTLVSPESIQNDALFDDPRHEEWRQRISTALQKTIARQRQKKQSLGDEIMLRPNNFDPGLIDRLCERLTIPTTLSSLGEYNPLRKFNSSDYSETFNQAMHKRDQERLRANVAEYHAAFSRSSTQEDLSAILAQHQHQQQQMQAQLAQSVTQPTAGVGTTVPGETTQEGFQRSGRSRWRRREEYEPRSYD